MSYAAGWKTADGFSERAQAKRLFTFNDLPEFGGNKETIITEFEEKVKFNVTKALSVYTNFRAELYSRIRLSCKVVLVRVEGLTHTRCLYLSPKAEILDGKDLEAYKMDRRLHELGSNADVDVGFSIAPYEGFHVDLAIDDGYDFFQELS